MINQPPLNVLVDKAGCRYLLVAAVAKRARVLQCDREALGNGKPVTVAVDEFFADKLILTTSEG